ncbi:leucine-rich_repeat domain-containing protein [Hexamita inflata]|uniref:Leucine-rich_repeat domain-containing protein n=1 Tax=Hexamita inflata TaxID=28002 RepID=A0ABP1HC90_9EUKA
MNFQMILQEVIIEDNQNNINNIFYPIRQQIRATVYNEFHIESYSATQIINLDQNGIYRDISMMMFQPKLQILEIIGCKLESLDGIEQLTKLQDIKASYNKFKTIQQLSSLRYMRTLNLNGNQLINLDGIQELTLLQKINLSCNKLTSIKQLSKLILCEQLDLSYNEITSVEPISNFSNLKQLNLVNNLVSSLFGLKNLVQLEALNILGNEVSDLRQLLFLKHLPNLKQMFIIGTEYLTSFVEDNHNECVFSPFYPYYAIKILPNIKSFEYNVNNENQRNLVFYPEQIRTEALARKYQIETELNEELEVELRKQ